MTSADLSAAFWFLVRCARLLATTDPRAFWLALTTAVVLAGACWWLCTNYSKLWNLRFKATALHNVLCAIAALLTLIFTIVYVSLGKAQELARNDIGEWRKSILTDRPWTNATFREVYHTVRKQGREDFSGHPTPEQGGSLIPMRAPQSKQTAARVYAERACVHFQRRHPFLSRMLWADSAAPTRRIAADVDRWFARNPGKAYDARNAIELAAQIIDQGLVTQSPRVVYLGRAAAISAFGIAQALPLLIIGWAAYRDLHETV